MTFAHLVRAISSGAQPSAGEVQADELTRAALSQAALRRPPRFMLSDARALIHRGGDPMDATSRKYFEPRFGHDFSQVRVHTNDSAQQSAAARGADAYTFDENIVFRAGRYDPHSPAGRQLLAHELAHVVQQRRTGVPVVQMQASAATPVISPADRIEALVSEYRSTRDDRTRLRIAEQVLTEVDHLAIAPESDAHTRAVLVLKAAAIRAELAKAQQRSPLKRAGAAAAAAVLVGGGPEEPVGDVAAAALAIGILAVALYKGPVKPDPAKIQDALDEIRDLLRKPEREPEKKPDPRQRPTTDPIPPLEPRERKKSKLPNAMRFQVQWGTRAGGPTFGLPASAPADPGVTTVQAVSTLTTLVSSVTPKEARVSAAPAAAKQVKWILSRPTAGVSNVRSWSEYFPYRRYTDARVDVENLRGHNLRQ